MFFIVSWLRLIILVLEIYLLGGEMCLFRFDLLTKFNSHGNEGI